MTSTALSPQRRETVSFPGVFVTQVALLSGEEGQERSVPQPTRVWWERCGLWVSGQVTDVV